MRRSCCGTNRTTSDVRSPVAIGGKPDIARNVISAAIDPKRALGERLHRLGIDLERL